MKKSIFYFLASTVLFYSCTNDDDIDDVEVIAPATYTFERGGESTVSFSGQTTRILMSQELIDGLKDTSKSEEDLDGMFTNTGDKFSDADLNASSKNIRSKTAASADFFSSNTTEANAIKADFDSWIAAQVNDVYPNWDVDAVAGTAGKIQEAGGGSTRYVNAKGLELNQAVNKSLIGALMVDQMLNNYLGTAVLDAGTNVVDNDAETVAEGKSYTTMEHKWDEAFGYLYGTDDATSPALGADSFLNKYLARVENDADYAGIAQSVYDAFKLGRAAIVAKNYEIRDEQAEIIREEISKVIAVRAIYYLQQGKAALDGGDYGSAFHDLSEGFGFIYSLQFTRQSNTTSPYFTKVEVDAFIAQLMADNGFWNVTAETLDSISEDIADAFGLTVAQAGS
ncbi:DUF4856 domain-containing protein [Urechidicola croceus]|uniref:DUF4856 domain-containing protein n=1 Tax=Urechidicola croceus TaxID=1850246 RepID=A0A1D8P9N9_9FLAO|nr:DUF4856 domain-containing protein [Urechidicola croceus]AOW21320.1 DUF4856 domain-containing protein [Urechidicola croceus]